MWAVLRVAGQRHIGNAPWQLSTEAGSALLPFKWLMDLGFMPVLLRKTQVL
jgi:hypothetical protein